MNFLRTNLIAMLLVAAIAMIASPAFAGFGLGCCRLVCCEKEVCVRCYGVKCIDFCLPCKGCRGCLNTECVCDEGCGGGCCDTGCCSAKGCSASGGCGDVCPCCPKCFCWYCWEPCGAQLYSAKHLMVRDVIKKVKIYRWEVSGDVGCCGCGAPGGAAPAQDSGDDEGGDEDVPEAPEVEARYPYNLLPVAPVGYSTTQVR